MAKVIIIAEAGVNHNGSIELARELVDRAKDSGADYVKFQSFKAHTLTSKKARMADYQIQNTKKNETQFDMLKKLELSDQDHLSLLDYCRSKDIGFMSSAFDVEGIEFLNSLKLDFFKVPSGEITNLLYLRALAKIQKPIVLSTGMSNLGEIQDALMILETSGLTRSKITVLHCNTEYPTPMKDVNLRAMQTIRDTLKVQVGYSDHTLGIEIPIAAVALGAVVIEKHFTLDRSMNGPDHKASLTPVELTQMVQSIRNVEIALGNTIKEASESESKNISIARKSIVANTAIKKGDIFTEKNLTVKRPGSGLSPMKWDSIVGTAANRDFEEDEMIEL